jgi:hypothetical protein
MKVKLAKKYLGFVTAYIYISFYSVECQIVNDPTKENIHYQHSFVTVDLYRPKLKAKLNES